jgi:hypothetical protein
VILLYHHFVLFIYQLSYVIAKIILNQKQLVEDQAIRAVLVVLILKWWYNDIFERNGEHI